MFYILEKTMNNEINKSIFSEQFLHLHPKVFTFQYFTNIYYLNQIVSLC